MNRLYARQCSVTKISNELGTSFTSLHHRQGIAKARNVRFYGLFHQEQLVGALMLGNPRTSKKLREFTTEILRLTFAQDVRVVGGASKLIRFFVQKEDPFDFFTYQDTSGEASSVYENSGMKLLEKARPKKILVKNGLSRSTAQNNYRDWFSLEQARRGPDRLLGTELGEVFKENGSRKTNIELFVEDLDYHLEEIPGDNVYGWTNPNITFYTYRITSTKDSGYYLGRRALRIPQATRKSCMVDPYFGSGGFRFKQWVSEVGAETLTKEVLGIYNTWRDVVAAEQKLIGQLYATDSNCKNSIGGGFNTGSSPTMTRIDNCPIHGEANFKANSCCSCATDKAKNFRICSIHGRVLHQGQKCSFCNSQKAISKKKCRIHGMVTHQGSKCSVCLSSSLVNLKDCLVHGRTKHRGGTCMKCNAQLQLSKQMCPIHGEATFKGRTCTLCTAQKAISIKTCSLHGETKHQGDVCTVCNTQKVVTLKECSIHGLTKHQGSTCNKCNALKSIQVEICPIHGETKFQGGKCSSCSNSALISIKQCPVHGASKHRGKSCYRCIEDRKRAKREFVKANSPSFPPS